MSLLVRLTAKEGLRLALLDVLNSYTDSLAAEPGTELFIVSVDPDTPNNVWLFEIFKDEAAQEAHRASAPFGVLMGVMPPLLDGPPAVLRMDPLRMSMQQGVLTDDWDF
jgi:quinol monooxygenase YgiN